MMIISSYDHGLGAKFFIFWARRDLKSEEKDAAMQFWISSLSFPAVSSSALADPSENLISPHSTALLFSLYGTVFPAS